MSDVDSKFLQGIDSFNTHYHTRLNGEILRLPQCHGVNCWINIVLPGPKTPTSWAPESDPIKPRHSTITPTENSSSPFTDESFESIGLGEPITSRHRGKRQTPSPLQRDSDPPLTLIPPTPAATPVSSSPLPMEDIPQAWLEERIGDFRLINDPHMM